VGLADDRISSQLLEVLDNQVGLGGVGCGGLGELSHESRGYGWGLGGRDEGGIEPVSPFGQNKLVVGRVEASVCSARSGEGSRVGFHPSTRSVSMQFSC
jgi:hypothetical protein